MDGNQTQLRPARFSLIAAAFTAIVLLSLLAYARNSSLAAVSPESAAIERLEEISGLSCIVARHALQQALSEDSAAQQRLASLGDQPGWVVEGRAFSGSQAAAAAALGGSIIASDANEVWIHLKRNGIDIAQQIARSSESRAGAVWLSGTSLRASADPDCQI